MFQQGNEPFLAIVIDPKRTALAGKVEIGAFRSFPEGFVPDGVDNSDLNIPVEKIEDFGVHNQAY